MTIRSRAYSKEGQANFDDIFRKPKDPAKTCGCNVDSECRICNPKAFCTHRESFCYVHQIGCGHHYNLQPDSRCECLPCDPKPSTKS